MVVKVSKEIKEALDGLVFKGESQITEKIRKKRIANIIRHHAKTGNWNGYKQLNTVELEDLIEMLTEGYEIENNPLEKVLDLYKAHLKTTKSLSTFISYDQWVQYNYSLGYVRAFQDLKNLNINMSHLELEK